MVITRENNLKNLKEVKAWRNILCAAEHHIYGMENAIEDGLDEYGSMASELYNHEALVESVYSMSVSSLHTRGGHVAFGPATESFLKDIRSLGKDRLMELCHEAVEELGY